MPRTYSRHPRIWRMNPSALASSTWPSRYARSARSITSFGCSKPTLIADASAECSRSDSPCCIASSYGPNSGSRSVMNRSSSSFASARVTGRENPDADAQRCFHPSTRCMIVVVVSSGAKVMRSGAGFFFGHGFRLSASKFHAPPVGVPSGSISMRCLRRISR